MRVLLITPPMTQLNTPYPATAFLAGYLRANGCDFAQADLSLELALRLFCRAGLREVLKALRNDSTAAVQQLRTQADDYLATVEPVVHFLQGRDPALALRIVSRTFLPEGPRFASLDELSHADETGSPLDPLHWAFGSMGVQDCAKHLATLYLEDLGDAIRDGIDPRFEFTRYAEKLSASAPRFDPILEALQSPPTLIDTMLEDLTEGLLKKHEPSLVAVTAPFPGNVYGAFRIAATVKRVAPTARIALGGGYPSTELRELSDPRVFDFFDFVSLDDGERPLTCMLEHLGGQRPASRIPDTFYREEGRVMMGRDEKALPVPHTETGTPTCEGLSMDRYISSLELLNPMHRIWSDGRWNKLMLAHGCYWSKCTFCDTSLNYIHRYSPATADHLVDQMEQIVKETGQTGFHFVDEAAPPALLRALAERLIDRGVVVTWWGNVRFEKTFTSELCHLLARSGCVALSGGLEAASNRLLDLMQKGVTVEQVARVTRNCADAGIMVHAYLMYGFPSQTEQETVDALEYVRQLFVAGCIQSGFWHRFALTAHSPIFADPASCGIRVLPTPKATFARNEVPFEDPVGCDHGQLGKGLVKSIYNFMHGVALDRDVHTWFDKKCPHTTVPPDFIERALEAQNQRVASA